MRAVERCTLTPASSDQCHMMMVRRKGMIGRASGCHDYGGACCRGVTHSQSPFAGPQLACAKGNDILRTPSKLSVV